MYTPKRITTFDDNESQSINQRLIVAGVVLGVLLVAMLFFAVGSNSNAPQGGVYVPGPTATAATVLHVGDRVYARGPYAARDASTSAAPVVCYLDPAKIGVLLELGASITSTHLDWGEVAIAGCTGWIKLDDLGKAIK